MSMKTKYPIYRFTTLWQKN